MAEYVEAEVIETPALLSGAERWLASAAERVTERCELYRPPTRIETEREYKDAKAARTQVRKDYAELDAERKAKTREIDDALKRFRSEVKDVLSPLSDIDERYKAAIDAYEEDWRVRRHIELSQEYLDLAPAIDGVVPFGVVLRRFGEERGHAWLNRSTNIEQAKVELADAVERIAAGDAQIDQLVPEEDREEVKAEYFATLDLQQALLKASQAKERRQRVAELERFKEESRNPQAEVEENPQPEHEGSGRPRYAPPESHAWVISIPDATRDQAMMVADFMRANGIVFDAIYSGTLEDALRKKRANGR